MTLTRPELVITGSGMTGIRTVKELLKLAPSLYDITMFGEEPHGNHSRILLSPMLAGEKQVNDIMLNTREQYDQNRIALHASDPIVAIDRPRRALHSHGGVKMRYDRLLIATGSRPFILSMSGHLLPGVIAFRDAQDMGTVLEAAYSHRHTVVTGGGLLGFEAANGLVRQDMDVAVAHLPNTLMERQLNRPAVQLLQKALGARGLRFLLGARMAELLGTDRVATVRFRGGTQIPVGLVVMTAGVCPDIELAKAAGLHCKRAIIADNMLQIYDPRIYAVGEYVQHRSATFDLVTPIWGQTHVCATRLTGAGHRRYVQQAAATKLKVIGVDLYSAGDFIGGNGTEDVVLHDPHRGVYKRLVLKEDCIVDAILYGGIADGPWCFGLIQCKMPITSICQRLLFGRALCETEIAQ